VFLSLVPAGRLRADDVAVLDRRVVVENVCAWPNLTVLRDGTIVAALFNQPSHGRAEGDVEVWASADGRAWQKRGTPARHEPGTNRMNVAAGRAADGDLVVLASGWSLRAPEKPDAPAAFRHVLQTWVCRSGDGGGTWTTDRQSFPSAEDGRGPFVPFGDLVAGADGALRAAAYAQENRTRRHRVWMFRSDDDGRSWKRLSLLADDHNETALFHRGDGRWLAAARRQGEGEPLNLFCSDDDGRTWRLDQSLTGPAQHPAHFLRLNDGRLVLTYGNRVKGEYGVAAKVSRDQGRTWSPQARLVSDAAGRDCGYPSSVQLPGGEILTAYYASGTAGRKGYHMGVVVWRCP
jgi:hypothetical protein